MAKNVILKVLDVIMLQNVCCKIFFNKMDKRGVESSVLHNCGESFLRDILLNVFDYTIIEKQ